MSMTPPHALTREQVVDKLVDKFLSWPLPDSVCSDLCASKQGYPHRSGTTLLAAHEAKKMFEHVLTELFEALAQQAQEVERLTKETAKYKALLLQSCTDNTEEYGVECKPKCNSHGHEDDCPVSHPGLVFQQLRKDLAAMTAERDEAVKWKGHHDAQVNLKRKLHEMNNILREELAASQQQYNELTQEGGELHSLQISNAQLQATLAERERRIAELEGLP